MTKDSEITTRNILETDLDPLRRRLHELDAWDDLDIYDSNLICAKRSGMIHKLPLPNTMPEESDAYNSITMDLTRYVWPAYDQSITKAYHLFMDFPDEWKLGNDGMVYDDNGHPFLGMRMSTPPFAIVAAEIKRYKKE